MTNKSIIDKFATAGLFVTAIFSPCCFPLYGFALSALGFGSVELFGGYTWYIFQGLVALALFGQFWSYSEHKNIFPLLIALISSALIFGSYHFYFSRPIIYSGMFGLLIATVVNHFAKRQAKSCPNCVTTPKDKVLIFQSIITCPTCGHSKKETMPHDACQFFYECTNCKTVLKPQHGDCCVYCSYGDTKCPSIQLGTICC
jgi:hypothetical protein